VQWLEELQCVDLASLSAAGQCGLAGLLWYCSLLCHLIVVSSFDRSLFTCPLWSTHIRPCRITDNAAMPPPLHLAA
jgi:hypothetical protein